MSAAEDFYEIGQLHQRYAFAVDGRDWPMFASCFTEDGAFVDIWGSEHRGRAAIVGFLEPMWRSMTTQHVLAAPLLEFDGDRANARTYHTAQHIRDDLGANNRCLVGGFYEDELRRAAEGWQLVRRQPKMIWFDGNIEIFSSGS